MVSYDESNGYNSFSGGYDLIPNSIQRRVSEYRIQDSFQLVPLVFSCCDLIGSSIAGIKLKFYEPTNGMSENSIRGVKLGSYDVKSLINGDRVNGSYLIGRCKLIGELEREGLLKEVNSEHEVIKLFNPPSDGAINNISELIYLTLVIALITGEDFWFLDNFRRGKPTSMNITSGYYMKPRTIKGENGDELVGWEFTAKYADGTEKKRNKEFNELVHNKLPNIYNNFRGLSPLKAGRFTIEQFMNIVIWNTGLFKEGVRPPIVIETDQAITGNNYVEFVKTIVRRFSGFLKGQHPMVLTRGAKARVLFNEREIDFLKSLEFTKEEITSIFHVPPAMVNIFRWANYANSKIQNSIFWELGNLPRMLWLKQNIQNQILDRYWPNVVVDWDWDSIAALRPDPKEFIEVKEKEVRTVGLYRDLGYGFEQIADILMNPKLIPIEPIEIDEPEDVVIELESYEPIYNDGIIEYKASEGLFNLYSDRYINKVLMPMSDKFISAFHLFLNEMQEVLIKGNNKGMVFPLHPIEWNTRWGQLSQRYIKDMFHNGIQSVELEVTQPKKMFVEMYIKQNLLMNELFTEEQNKRLQNLVAEINEKTNFIVDVIEEFNKVVTIQGTMTKNDMENYIITTVEQLKNRYSRTVGKSTMGAAYSIGRQIGMSHFNVIKHIWIASKNASRPAHINSHGEERKLDEKFSNGLRFPFDPTIDRKDTFNCECTTIVSMVKAGRAINILADPIKRRLNA